MFCSFFFSQDDDEDDEEEDEDDEDEDEDDEPEAQSPRQIVASWHSPDSNAIRRSLWSNHHDHRSINTTHNNDHLSSTQILIILHFF